MKIIERLTDLLATPGLPRWRLFSLALLVPIAFGLLLGDLLGVEDGGFNLVTLTLGGLFFLSQAVLYALTPGQLRHKPGVFVILLLLATGMFYMAFGEPR